MTNAPNWNELEYYPSLRVPNCDEIYETWRLRAGQARMQMPSLSEHRYGAHPREILDFIPAPDAKACIVYIHGGYWLSFSKYETSWVAESFLQQGISVALFNYPLCPEVKIGGIRASVMRATTYLWKQLLTESERRRLIITGHSAGGYLAAAHLVQDWRAASLPATAISGVIALSGVFDVAPLIPTSMNADLHITEISATEMNLVTDRPRSPAKLVLAVGSHESEEFHRQSDALAEAWGQLLPACLDLSGFDHFTILEDLASPTGRLNGLAVEMARR